VYKFKPCHSSSGVNRYVDKLLWLMSPCTHSHMRISHHTWQPRHHGQVTHQNSPLLIPNNRTILRIAPKPSIWRIHRLRQPRKHPTPPPRWSPVSPICFAIERQSAVDSPQTPAIVSRPWEPHVQLSASDETRVLFQKGVQSANRETSGQGGRGVPCCASYNSARISAIEIHALHLISTCMPP
jgi:hypothetical protein